MKKFNLFLIARTAVSAVVTEGKSLHRLRFTRKCPPVVLPANCVYSPLRAVTYRYRLASARDYVRDSECTWSSRAQRSASSVSCSGRIKTPTRSETARGIAGLTNRRTHQFLSLSLHLLSDDLSVLCYRRAWILQGTRKEYARALLNSQYHLSVAQMILSKVARRDPLQAHVLDCAAHVLRMLLGSSAHMAQRDRDLLADGACQIRNANVGSTYCLT